MLVECIGPTAVSEIFLKKKTIEGARFSVPHPVTGELFSLVFSAVALAWPLPPYPVGARYELHAVPCII